MLHNEGDRLTRVVVCTPRAEYFRVADLKAHNITKLADRERTRQQHDRLKTVMAESGADVLDVSELAGHPNSVFTRDVALCTPRGYVKLRMGLETRRGEETWMSKILEPMGEPCAGEIEEPGTVEGGDVILAGSVAFVGRSRRTNQEGVRQISVLLREMDYEVRTVSVVETYLHLGGAMSVIAPRRVVCCRGVFPDGFFEGFDVVEITSRGPSTGNVICLSGSEVIANEAENRVTMRVLEDEGVKVHGIDLSEFRKGTGGPTCLILPVERQ
ncbi:MAG: dimethylarginine dimethylaminohydrolase family protein [Acidobacteriota bacterium]